MAIGRRTDGGRPIVGTVCERRLLGGCGDRFGQPCGLATTTAADIDPVQELLGISLSA